MKRIKEYIGAVVLGSAMLAIPGCTDTFNEHYDVEDGGNAATETLWEIISNNPNLSRFKDIAEKATYYRDEKHPQTGYTFKDMLQSSMLVTVWVPENSAFTDATYNDWMNMAEERGYTVQQQLMNNSITLWRQIATGGGVDTLSMLNGKRLAFNKDKYTMADVDIIEKNIPAVNGTLHTTSEILPFRYNLYEFLKDGTNSAANQVSRMHNYVEANDTTYFNPNASIEGTPNADGLPTYVDSVYHTSNTLFFGTHRFPKDGTEKEEYVTYTESFGAYIEAEDSTFLMILPTDNAWQTAYNKLEKYYNYAENYVHKDQWENGTKLLLVGNNDGAVLNTDSLKDVNINMDIISPLCFTLHQQPNANDEIGKWKLDEFLSDKGARASYFYNTFGDTLRSDEEWDKTQIFNGTQIELSNGVGFVSNEWPFPSKFYRPDLTMEIGKSFFYRSSHDASNQANKYTISSTLAKDWIDEKGRVSDNDFYCISPNTPTGQPTYEFKLRGTDGENRESEVMSTKYEIGIVVVPNYYKDSSQEIVYVTEGTPNLKNAYVESTTIPDPDDPENEITIQTAYPVKHKIRAKLSYCNNPTKQSLKDDEIICKEIDWSGEKVDTLWLQFSPWDETTYKPKYTNETAVDKLDDSEFLNYFEFPYSYKNLRNSYPTLSISATAKTTDINGNPRQGIIGKYTNALCIDRIIMRCKED